MPEPIQLKASDVEVTNDLRTDTQKITDTAVKYSPLIKSIGAIGVGLLSDSPMAKGIALGLSRSADSEIEARKVEAELRREAQMQAIEQQKQAQLDRANLTYKVGKDMFGDDPVLFGKYLDKAGYYEAMGVLKPQIPDPENPGTNVDFNALKQVVDGIQDEDLKAMANATLAGAMDAGNARDFASMNTGLNRFYNMVKPSQPDNQMWFNEDNEGFFGTEADAYQGGYYYKSPKRVEPEENPNKDVLSGLDKSYKDAVKEFRGSTTNNLWDPATAQAFSSLGAAARDMLEQYKLAGQEIGLIPGNPFPQHLDNIYEIVAAVDYVMGSDVDKADLTYDRIEQEIRINIDTIKDNARKMADIPAPITPPPTTSKKTQTGLKGDDLEQYNFLIEQMALPAGDRHPGFQGAYDDLKKRYPGIDI